MANSPILGTGHKIRNIHEAAMYLGLKRLKSVSIGMAAMSNLLNTSASKHFNPHDLWLHSMTVAVVMNTLSLSMPQFARPDEDQIFLSGLVHDIGLMALHHLDKNASDELHHQLHLQPKRPICEIELEMLGVTHCQIGAQLLKHWGLPQEIIQVVALHHSTSLDTEPFTQINSLVRLAVIAEHLLPDFGIAEHTNTLVEKNEWVELFIDAAHVDNLTAMVNELAMQVTQLPEALKYPQSDTTTETRTVNPSADNNSFGRSIRHLYKRIVSFLR